MIFRKTFIGSFWTMTWQYSCAYFVGPDDSLETAQKNKKNHIAAKLMLEPGHHVLDIGCGWDGLGIHLVKEHGAHVTGVTLSCEQHNVPLRGQKNCRQVPAQNFGCKINERSPNLWIALGP